MDWFQYDNGLRHERVNMAQGKLFLLKSFFQNFGKSIKIYLMEPDFRETPNQLQVILLPIYSMANVFLERWGIFSEYHLMVIFNENHNFTKH